MGCAALVFGIGRYARRRTEPMWFWAGSTVEKDAITDAAVTLLVLDGTAGIVWLVVE